MMERNETAYQSPLVEVIDIIAESIICASDNETYQDNQTDGWY